MIVALGADRRAARRVDATLQRIAQSLDPYYAESVKPTTLRLPDELSRELDRIAEERHVTRSDIAREALEQYCSAVRKGQHGSRVTLLQSLVTYPGSGRGDLARQGRRYLREMFDAKRRRHRPR